MLFDLKLCRDIVLIKRMKIENLLLDSDSYGTCICFFSIAIATELQLHAETTQLKMLQVLHSLRFIIRDSAVLVSPRAIYLMHL